MTIRSWPYSTASPGSTRLAPTTPSAGATTSCGTPSMSTAPSRSPARTRVPARASARGWKMPTAGEVATSRSSVRLSRWLPPLTPSRASRPGPTGVSAHGRGVPGAARAGAGGSARGRPAALRAPAFADGRRPGPAQADAPGALADLELAEAGRPELGDEGGQQLDGQAVDGGVIGRPLAPRTRSGRRPTGLASTRARARPPRGPAVRRATRTAPPTPTARRPGSSRSRRRSARPRSTGGASSGISVSV